MRKQASGVGPGGTSTFTEPFAGGKPVITSIVRDAVLRVCAGRKTPATYVCNYSILNVPIGHKEETNISF